MFRIIDAILMITNSLQSFIGAILIIAHSIPQFYSRQNIIRIMPPDLVSIKNYLWSEHFLVPKLFESLTFGLIFVNIRSSSTYTTLAAHTR